MSKLGPIKLFDRNQVLNSGYSGSQTTQDMIDKEISEIIHSQLDRAKMMIKDNLKLLELIKDTLLEKETIVLEEIEYLAKNLTPLPEGGLGTEEKVEKPADLGGILEEVSTGS